MTNLYRRCATLALIGALSACGGGGGDSDATERSFSNEGSDPSTVFLPSEQSCGIDNFAAALTQSLNALRAAPQQCGATAQAAVGPMSWSEPLTQAALGHSRDMAANNFFSHTGSDGRSPASRIHDAGHLGPTVGETLAAASNSVPVTLKALMNSPPHCEVLMNPRLRLVGAACVKNPRTTHKTYWTLNFGA